MMISATCVLGISLFFFDNFDKALKKKIAAVLQKRTSTPRFKKTFCLVKTKNIVIG